MPLAALFDLLSGRTRRNNNIPRDAALYAGNNTVFGEIFRGTLPADVLYEDDEVLVFRDIAPVSEFHALVIPKRLITHCDAAQSTDVPLLRHMQTTGLQALQQEYPELDVSAACAASTVSMGS